MSSSSSSSSSNQQVIYTHLLLLFIAVSFACFQVSSAQSSRQATRFVNNNYDRHVPVDYHHVRRLTLSNSNALHRSPGFARRPAPFARLAVVRPTPAALISNLLQSNYSPVLNAQPQFWTLRTPSGQIIRWKPKRSAHLPAAHRASVRDVALTNRSTTLNETAANPIAGRTGNELNSSTVATAEAALASSTATPMPSTTTTASTPLPVSSVTTIASVAATDRVAATEASSVPETSGAASHDEPQNLEPEGASTTAAVAATTTAASATTTAPESANQPASYSADDLNPSAATAAAANVTTPVSEDTSSTSNLQLSSTSVVAPVAADTATNSTSATLLQAPSSPAVAVNEVA